MGLVRGLRLRLRPDDGVQPIGRGDARLRSWLKAGAVPQAPLPGPGTITVGRSSWKAIGMCAFTGELAIALDTPGPEHQKTIMAELAVTAWRPTASPAGVLPGSDVVHHRRR